MLDLVPSGSRSEFWVEGGRRPVGNFVRRSAVAAGPLFQTAQPIVIKNLQEEDDFIHSGLLQEHGIISLLQGGGEREGAAVPQCWIAEGATMMRRRSFCWNRELSEQEIERVGQTAAPLISQEFAEMNPSSGFVTFMRSGARL